MSSGYFRTSSGGSLATLDINSDGLGDLLIGSIDVTTGIGSVIAVLGDAGGFDATFDLNVADGSNSVILDGATAGSEFSWDIANIGNVNGGGADDFAIVSRADGTVRVLLDPNSADAGYTVTKIVVELPIKSVSGLLNAVTFGFFEGFLTSHYYVQACPKKS